MNPYSKNALAQCYENVWGIDKDISKVSLWYRSSAELDHAPAMWNLGRVFDKGICVEANEASAFDWYGKAAKRGHVEAAVALADCYLEGRGITRNKDEAIAHFQDAARQGYNPWQKQSPAAANGLVEA